MVVGIIIAAIVLFIVLTGMSGVGIKSSLRKEIYSQCYNGNAGSKYYPSISFEEAYKVLNPFDANSKHSGVPDWSSYDFWALVGGTPCLITIKKEPFKNGIRLSVTRKNDYLQIAESINFKNKVSIPTNLKSI